jgi:acid stress chaperone HdeA
MKSVHIALMVAIAIPVGAAADTKKPVAKWTCADFLGVDDTIKPKAVYWATAHAKAGKPETTTINIEATEKVVPFIIDDCTRAPQDSFWQKLKAAWKKVDAEMKAVEKKI